MKKLLTLIFTIIGLPLFAADSTIGNLTPITTVPGTYRMPWENPGVLDYYITFQNLTNQILSGYASQAFANAAAQAATNGFPWGVLYDPAGAAQAATNGFPWGVLYDPAGSAQAATNGYPWGVLYDPAGAAQGATNPIPGWISASNANYLPLTGGTVSGPVHSTSSTTNGPANNEFPVAGWVRGLFNQGADYFVTTNIDATATNLNSGQPVYQFASTIPLPDARTYTTANFLTNGGYLGSVITTNTFQSIGGAVDIHAVMAYTGGSSTPTLSIHPELYYSYDRTNWQGDFAGNSETITYGSTNIYDWAISFPNTTSTNANGFYVMRRYKCDSVTGAGTRTFTILIGTNSLTGPNDAAHVTMQSPTATSGNAYLAANQTFTGTNTFTQPLILSGGLSVSSMTVSNLSGNGSGLTNVSAATATTSTNDSLGRNISTTYAPLNGTNNLSGTNTFSSPGTFSTVFQNGLQVNTNGISIHDLSASGNAHPLAIYAGAGNGGGTISQDAYMLVAGTTVYAVSTTTHAFTATTYSAGTGVTDFNLKGATLEVANTITATNGLKLPGSSATIKFTSVTASNPPTSGAGTAFLFAATNSAGTAEIFTMDGAGVISQQSPHALDAPPQLIDDDDEAPLILKEILQYTGKVRWINKSRQARIAEMHLKLSLNSLAYYQFTTGKSPTQWTNSNSYGFYTNAVAFLDPLTAAQKQLIIVESFADYNTRMGLTNNNGLVKANWANDQARFQSEYAVGFTNSLVSWTNDYSAWTTNVLTQTNLPPPVYPTWAPPPVQPLPSWLQKRGVN